MSNVVIVGASRGIGLALVHSYVDSGDTVYAMCRDPKSAEKLIALQASRPDAVRVMQLDVLDESSLQRVVAELGDTPVDILVNVAGIFQSEAGPQDNDFSHWRESFEAMAIAPFRTVLAFLPALEKAKGKVMSVSSQIGATTWPYGGMYSYAAAKAALNRTMIALALDVKDRGVSVGLVHPGYVQTDMGGPNADISPKESAEGIHAVISRLNLENSGGFWKWNGDVHPW